MIKKIAVLFLTVALLFSFVPVVLAQEPVVTVFFSQQEVTVGDTFTVTIDAQGTGITKVTAQLDFNSHINYKTGNMGFDTDTMRYTVSFKPSKAPLVIECVASKKGMAQMIFKDIKLHYADSFVEYEDTGAQIKICPQYTPIYTKEQLSNIRNNLSGNYILMNDIVFDESDFEEGGDFYFDGFGWRPIGAVVSDCFGGTFNGNGYAIRGLKMSKAYYNFGGLFGVSRGEIENLRVIDAVIDGEYGINTNISSGSVGNSGKIDYNDKDVWTDPDTSEEGLNKYDRNGVSSATVGIICGYNLGVITDTFASGTVKGNTYVGAVAGRSTGTVSGCAVDAQVESKLTAGGICGVTGNSATVTDCVSQGSVSASVSGGIIGSAKGNVTRVYTTSEVYGGTAHKDYGEGAPVENQVYTVNENQAAHISFDGGNWDYDRIIPYPSAVSDLIAFKSVWQKGDINKDNSVGTTDLALLKLALAQGTADALSNADMDDDGAVTTTDLALLKLLLPDSSTNFSRIYRMWQ